MITSSYLYLRPIYLLCGTCGYEYNYILKFENISLEEPFFIDVIGASGRYLRICNNYNCLYYFYPNSDLLHSKWENSNKLNISDDQLLEVYFEMLSDEEIMKLYKIYEADFQQFQYKFNFRGIEYK